MSEVPPPFDAIWFLFLTGFIVGACLGSFVTMLSYRLPRGLSIVTPPSHCTSCHKNLQAIDLVPLASWLANGGKCRQCGSKVSARYMWIELATATLCALALAQIGFRPLALLALALITALVTLLTIFVEQKKG